MVDEVTYLHVLPGITPAKPAIHTPFKTVIVAESNVDPAWMVDVCDRLIEAGCLYIMAWGEQGSLWDDAGDWANLERHGYGEISSEKSVMTTWHDHEAIEDVFCFCRHGAEHQAVPLTHTLILHVSTSPDESALLKSFASQGD